MSLLDSFRIINFLEIDYIAVIKGFFIILGFKEDNMNKNIQDFIFFLQNISSSYEFQQYLYQKNLQVQDLVDIRYRTCIETSNVFTMKNLNQIF